MLSHGSRVSKVEQHFLGKLNTNFVQASRSVDFEILRGLTNSLIYAKEPDEVTTK